MSTVRHWLRAHLFTVAFLILAVATAYTVAEIQVINNDRFEEQERRNDAICEANAETRQAVVDVVATLGADVPDDPNADAQTRERIRVSNEARHQAKTLTEQRLHPDLCADNKPPQSHLETPVTTKPGG